MTSGLLHKVMSLYYCIIFLFVFFFCFDMMQESPGSRGKQIKQILIWQEYLESPNETIPLISWQKIKDFPSTESSVIEWKMHLMGTVLWQITVTIPVQMCDLRETFDHLEPQFPHQKTENNNNFLIWLSGLYEVLYIMN